MPPISKTGNDRFSRILFWVGILIIPTILIIQVLVYQPFFGHMDDGNRLSLVDGVATLQALQSFALFHGNAFGYFGATATGMSTTLPGYVIGHHFGASALFVVNVMVLSFCMLTFAWGLRRVMNWSSNALIVVTVTAFLWPFTFEMVFFPSLQEKGLMLAIGLLFWWVASGGRVKNSVLFWSSSLVLFAMSATTKTQVVVFLPAIALAALLTPARFKTRARQLGIVVLSTATGLFVALVGLTGSYSGAQRSGDLASTFRSTYSVLILGIVVVYGVYLGVRFLSGSRNYLELIPLVMMATFWVSIVYFGYRNYFLSIFGVMFGSAVAVVVGNLKSVKLQQLATVGLIVVTVGWTLYRIPQVFEPLHGIGAFTQGQIAKDLADEDAVIYTSCVEGSGHFNYYTERKWGVTPEFKPLEGDGAGYRFGIPDDGQYVFGDRRLCAVPGEIAAWDMVWASPGDDGFRLYKRPA
jgi:hypothetical protein